MGIFPGAEVMKGPIWPYGREVRIIYYILHVRNGIQIISLLLVQIFHRRGVVIPAPKGGKGGKVRVNWISTNKRRFETRCYKNQLTICAKETVDAMLASSGRIDWKVKDKQGYNILHLSVLKNYLKYYFF